MAILGRDNCFKLATIVLWHIETKWFALLRNKIASVHDEILGS